MNSIGAQLLIFVIMVIGVAVVLLVVFSPLFLNSSTPSNNNPPRAQQRAPRRAGPARKINFIPSFEYRRQDNVDEEGFGDSQCAICISEFEEGEKLKRMPKCKHLFHAVCIDMWLYSHSDCPRCRAPVEPPPGPVLRPQPREGLIIRGPDLV